MKRLTRRRRGVDLAAALGTSMPSRRPIIGFTRHGKAVHPIAGGDGTTTVDLIKQVGTQREARFGELESIVTKAAEEDRGKFSEDEQKRYDELTADVVAFDDRLTDLSKAAEREALQAQANQRFEERKPDGRGSHVRVTGEPLTYERHAPVGFFRDVASIAQPGRWDQEAIDRMARHRQEMEIEARAVSRTDTTSAGEFVPPLWLVDEYGEGLRAGRVAANLCTELDLPPGTDSINIPTLNGGTTQLTTTAAQTSDNAALSSTDLISNTVTAGVKTIGGFEDIALQVLEQSPLSGGMDQLIFNDLAQDYAKRLDLQVLNGSGSAGQALGILGTTGINSITYTQASPTVITHYPVLAQLLSNIAKNRFLGPNAILMTPSRWYWFMAALDSQNRPFLVPNLNGPFNAMGIDSTGVNAPADVPAGGPAGWILGLPVYLDANIPTNVGAGTNEDRIIVGRFSDALLFEGPLRVSAHPDALASSMGMRLRLYRYFAFTAGRYPVSFATATGTGNIVTTVLAGF
jgi:HK97 family phage major capsid protein